MAKEGLPTADSDRPSTGGSLVARMLRPLSALAIWARAKPLLAALIVVPAMAAIIVSAVALTLAFRGSDRPAYMRQLAQALAHLDAGDLPAARRLAAALLVSTTTGFEEQGGPYYVLGAATAREAAEQNTPSRRRVLNLVASRYLDEARQRGFPPGREHQGLLLLAQTLHDAARFDRSIAVLHSLSSEETKTDPNVDLLLADDYLKVQPPRFTEALEHIHRHLSGASLSGAELEAGQVTEARILLAKGDLAAAWEAAARLPASSPVYGEAVILRGRILLESLSQPGNQPLPDVESRVATLSEELAHLVQKTDLPPTISAQTQLLAGLVELQQGHIAQARSLFDRTRRAYFGQPEGLAALVFLADLIRSSNPQTAVELYKPALAQAGAAETYDNPWLPAERLSRHSEAAIGELAAADQFDAALELATALTPFFPSAPSLARQVEIHRAYARKLEERAQNEKSLEAEVTAAQARREWREAGAKGRQLANVRIATRFYL